MSLVLAGLASVPGTRAQAATAPQEGEHDVVVNANPVDTTPHVQDGNTQAVVDLGSRVIVGGKFTQVKRYNQAALFTRNNIFAYDKATGAIDTTFVPELDGQVTAMLKAADGNIYVAGQFKNVNGRPAATSKLNPVTGQKVTALNGDTERDGLRPAPTARAVRPGRQPSAKIRNLVLHELCDAQRP